MLIITFWRQVSIQSKIIQRNIWTGEASVLGKTFEDVTMIQARSKHSALDRQIQLERLLDPIHQGQDVFRPKWGYTIGTYSLQSVSLQAETYHQPNVKRPSIQQYILGVQSLKLDYNSRVQAQLLALWQRTYKSGQGSMLFLIVWNDVEEYVEAANNNYWQI